MKVLFCCLGDFKAPPGARQILLLARALQAAGHECLLLVEGDPATVRLVEGGAGDVQVGRYEFSGPRLHARTRRQAVAFAPDVVHCYEPRTAPLSAALQIARACAAPLCVRFADDDELLYREAGGSGVRRLLGRPALLAAGTVAPRRWPYKHPLVHRRMLAVARGYDAITPALAAEISARYGVDCEAILPALDVREEPPAGGGDVRERLGLGDGPIVLYTGSVFRPHYPDFELLLRAFALVSAEHPQARLVHTGRIADRYNPAGLRRIAGAPDRTHLLGFLERPEDLRALMAEAAVLAQPGAPSEFNRLRLPAKVHDYLLAGRPVVTFSVGFGELLRDGEHAVLTRTDDPAELARAILALLGDPDGAGRIGEQGRRRAVELFAPDAIVAQTLGLYSRAAA